MASLALSRPVSSVPSPNRGKAGFEQVGFFRQILPPWPGRRTGLPEGLLSDVGTLALFRHCRCWVHFAALPNGFGDADKYKLVTRGHLC